MHATSEVCCSTAGRSLRKCAHGRQKHATSDVSRLPETRNVRSCVHKARPTQFRRFPDVPRQKTSSTAYIADIRTQFRRFCTRRLARARGDSSQIAFGEGEFLTNCVWRGTIPAKVRLAREIPRFSHLASLARLTFVGKSLVRLTFVGILPREIDFCGNVGRKALARLTFVGMSAARRSPD